MTAPPPSPTRPRREKRLVIGFVVLAVLLVVVGAGTSVVLSDPCRRLNQPAEGRLEVIPTPADIPGVDAAAARFTDVVPVLGPLRLAFTIPDGARLVATGEALLVVTDTAVTSVSPGFGRVGSTRDLAGFELYPADTGPVSLDPGTGHAAVFDEQLLQQSCVELDPSLPVLAASGGLVLQRDGDVVVATRPGGGTVWTLPLDAAATGARFVARGALVTTTSGVLLIDTVAGTVQERWDLPDAELVDTGSDRALVRGASGPRVLVLDAPGGTAVAADSAVALLDGLVVAVDGCALRVGDAPAAPLLPSCDGVAVDRVVTTGNGFTAMAVTVTGAAPTVLVFGPLEAA